MENFILTTLPVMDIGIILEEGGEDDDKNNKSNVAPKQQTKD